jgi:hypothetical protein
MMVTFTGDGLGWYAQQILSADSPPKLVVMGHTHVSQAAADDLAYYNDGCWCAGTPSYVRAVDHDAELLVPENVAGAAAE